VSGEAVGVKGKTGKQETEDARRDPAARHQKAVASGRGPEGCGM